jgi:flagellar hook-length control protein FliK
VDSKIGSDIAKLLGTLNAKAKDSASKSTGNGGEGASFKRALVASESVHLAAGDGKRLPVSGPLQTATRPIGPAVQQASRDLATGEAQAEKHTLRDFDLVLVGDQTEEAAVRSFAQKSGMSADALAQLFTVSGQSATLYSKLESLGLIEKLQADVSAALTNNVAAQAQSPSQIADVSAQLAQLTAPALERMLEGREALPNQWLTQLAAEIEPRLDNAAAGMMTDLRALVGASADISDTQLSASIASVVAPSVAALLSEASVSPMFTTQGQGPSLTKSAEALGLQLENAIVASLFGNASDNAGASANIGLQSGKDIQAVAKELATSLARVIASEATPVAGNLVASAQPVSAERLAPLVQGWIGQPAVQGRISDALKDGAIQPKALSLAIAPEVTQWLRTNALPRAVTDMAQLTPAMAMAAMQPSAVSDAELRLARSAAVAQPLPLQVSVSGAVALAGASLTQAAAATLAQVQPSADPGYMQAMAMADNVQAPKARQATMDRFAMRGVSVNANQLTADAKIDGAVNLRDLLISRAAGATAPEKSIPTTNAFLAGDSVDPATSKLIAQAEAGLARQNTLSGSDRIAQSDGSKPGYPPPGNQLLAREAAGRQLSEALGHRLAANIAAGHYRLTLNVHPKELGAIDVVMEMRDGKLDAQISSTNAVTRELLGDSLPRLRDALQQNGIQLAQLAVGQDSQQGGERGRGAQSGASDEGGEVDQLMADASENILEDLDLDLDLDTIDFWA